MTAVSEFEELAIWQLAKSQADALSEALVNNAEENKEKQVHRLTSSSVSVIECIEECYKRPSSIAFQKNFLVIAKSFNSECWLQVEEFTQKHEVEEKTKAKLLFINKRINQELSGLLLDLQKPGSGQPLIHSNEAALLP